MGAMDFFTDINLHYGELKLAVIDKYTGDPVTGHLGQVYYNTTLNVLKICVKENPVTWTALATGGDAAALETQVTYLKNLVGMNDSGQATQANGTITKDVNDLKGTTSDLGTRMTTAENDIDAIEAKFTNGTSGTYYKVTTTDGVVTSGQTSLAESDVTNLVSDLAAKAPLASPALTGTPTAPTAAKNTDTTQIATTAFVVAEINDKMNAANAMIFKGILGSNTGDVTSLPAAHQAGWTYKVRATGTWAGQSCEAGDMVVCIADGTTASNADWTVIQANITGAVTGPDSSVVDHVVTFSGTSGKTVKDSGFTIGKSVPADAEFTDTTYAATAGQTTITGANNAIGLASSGATAGSYGDSAAQTPSYGGTFKVPYVKVDTYGRVTEISEHTVTLPASDNVDTKVTQTADSSNTEIPIILKGTGSSGSAATVRYDSGVTVNPSTDTVTASKFVGSLEGNASSATKLETGRTFSITGGASAAAQTFTGEGNLVLNVTSLDPSKINGKIPAANNLYIGGITSVTVSTANTPVTVTLSGLSGYPYTLTLYDSTHKVVMAEVQGTEGGAKVTCSVTGTYYLGWFGLRA